MGRIYDAMVTFFREDNWKFMPLEGQPSLLMSVTGKNANFVCYAKAREEQEQFLFYSVYPVKAPTEKRFLAAEYVTRANYGLVIGNLELDMSDGEVRYKTSIDVEGAQLNSALIKQLVYTNLSTADRYYPGFASLIYASISPEQAVMQVEGR
ncbi:MAG TPA: YbjN domain-containing protein [Ktedonobacterales bacterium]|nr:YbjN domain-containing protein [Ktedonobacterales bacterium]